MRKTEVYSWRLSPEVKQALEVAARRETGSVGALLDRIVSEWLAATVHDSAEDDAQARLRAAARESIGAIHGGDRRRAETVRRTVRRRLASRRGR